VNQFIGKQSFASGGASGAGLLNEFLEGVVHLPRVLLEAHELPKGLFLRIEGELRKVRHGKVTAIACIVPCCLGSRYLLSLKCYDEQITVDVGVIGADIHDLDDLA